MVVGENPAHPSDQYKQHWSILRKTLRIDETSLRGPAAMSMRNRHGSGINLEPESRLIQMVKFTRCMLDRAFEFLRNGKQVLDENRFPLLKMDPS